MGRITDEMYEAFQKGLEAVNADCVRIRAAGLGAAVAELFKKSGIPDANVVETELMKEGHVLSELEKAGITAYTDHIRLHGETAKGGVTEAQYGIAALGSLIQCRDNVDERITATMCEYYIGIIKGSAIVPDYDDMFDILCEMKELPNFVGFITGPSRTADIECVSTVGVHGPLRMTVIVVDDI